MIISIHVSTRIYAYLRISTCIYAYLRVSTHIRIYLHVSTRIYAYPYASTRIYAYLRISACIYAYLRVSTQMTSYGGKNADVLWREIYAICGLSYYWHVIINKIPTSPNWQSTNVLVQEYNPCFKNSRDCVVEILKRCAISFTTNPNRNLMSTRKSSCSGEIYRSWFAAFSWAI